VICGVVWWVGRQGKGGGGVMNTWGYAAANTECWDWCC
jgi:hypothetical protein